MKLRANGISINYELAGEGDCLVLIHGAGDNLRMWYEQVPAFCARLQSPDLRRPRLRRDRMPGSRTSTCRCSRRICESFSARWASRRAFVLGFSMGGRIALQLALDEPSMVRALILANSAIPWAAVAGATAKATGIDRGARTRRTGDRFRADDGAIVFARAEGARPGAVRALHEDQASQRPALLRASLEGDGAVAAARPRTLACPVLLIAGEHDAFMPLESMRERRRP